MRPLNFDILTYVLMSLSQREALSVSTVCKAIHRIVIRDVLSKVVLGTPNAVLKFPIFLFADSSKRLPLLHTLTVNDDAVDFESYPARDDECDVEKKSSLYRRDFAAFLTQVFTQSRHLRALSLPLSEVLLRESPALQLALIEYDALIEISLADIGHHNALQAIGDMRSRLHTLSLSAGCEDVIDLHSVLSCMEAHRQLQKISFREVRCGRLQLDNAMHWPAVRDLKISGCPFLDLDPFVKAFPNLRTLCLEDLGHVREMDDSDTQWTKLESLEGDYVDISRLSLRCPVRHLILSTWICEEHLEDPVHVFERTQPMILSAVVPCNSEQEIWDVLAKARVRLLDLSIAHDGLSSPTDDWIKNIPQTMHRFQAPYLCIKFEPWDPDDLKRAHCAEIEVAEGLTGLQDVLAKSLPHLRFLAITVGPNFCLGKDDEYIELPAERTWWRIHHHDGDGKDSEAELIPRWKGEALWNRLHDMDYDSLLKLKPDEIVLD